MTSKKMPLSKFMQLSEEEKDKFIAETLAEMEADGLVVKEG